RRGAALVGVLARFLHVLRRVVRVPRRQRVDRVALPVREALTPSRRTIARRHDAVSVLGCVTNPPTHWRLPAAGLALVLAAGAAFAADAPAAQDERARAHAEFRRLFDAGDYSAAVEQGRKVVELTGGPGSGHDEELQVALMNLALAQQRAGDYVAAEAGFQRVIELIESSGRLTSPRLARAY